MRTRHYETIEVEAYGRLIGAEVRGIDLRMPLTTQTKSELEHAIDEHLVLFFRDQELTHEQHTQFARSFGELDVHPACPHVPKHPEMIAVEIDENSTDIRQIWHSDLSCREEPPSYSILRRTVGPQAGGDTLFTSCRAAYDALSPTLKQFLAPLRATHASDHIFRGRYRSAQEDIARNFPEHDHPIVRTHPRTGEKSLFVNHGYTTSIPALTHSESYSVLSMLLRHLEDPEFQCRFVWRDHSVVMWDNRNTLHRAIWDFWPERRVVFRVSVRGEAVV